MKSPIRIVRLLVALVCTPALSAESIPGVVSTYADLELEDGATLTSIIAAPAAATSELRPILFAQWVSCGSIAYREGSNARELLAALARDSGLALVRVERDAISGGPACEDLDFDTELAHYVDAYTQILASGAVDASAIYVYGSSLGAMTAPLLAAELQRRGYDIAGIVVQGGGAVTYLERMLNFERHYLERRPGIVEPAEIHGNIHDRFRFQYEYLVRGRHPDDVANDSAAMAAIRGDILGMSELDHYGRPFAWHQQLAKKNVLAAWREVDAPVLVIFNTFDQFETRHGHKLIADMANRWRPGSATYIERPSIGHSDNRYATIEEAYAFENGTTAWQDAADTINRWLRERL